MSLIELSDKEYISSFKKLSNDEVISRFKACVALDSELTTEISRSYRHFPEWSKDVQVMTYENGGGNDLVIIIHQGYILIKGFDHESDVSPHSRDDYSIWPGMYEGAPTKLLSILDNEAFEKDHVTFCIWRGPSDKSWKQGPVIFNNNEDDGSYLLSMIMVSPEEFIDWGKYYYGDSFKQLTNEKIINAFQNN